MSNRWTMIKNNSNYYKSGSMPASGGVGGNCSSNLVGARARRTSGSTRGALGRRRASVPAPRPPTIVEPTPPCCDALNTDKVSEGARNKYFTGQRTKETVETSKLARVSALDVHADELTVGGAAAVGGALSVDGALTVNGGVTSAGALSASDVHADELTVNGAVAARTLTAMGDIVAASFITKSDRRLKRDIESISSARGREVVSGLRACTYKLDQSPVLLRAGFIAQEVRDVAPHLVSENSTGTLGVDMLGIIPYLVAEVKELRIELEKIRSSWPR